MVGGQIGHGPHLFSCGRPPREVAARRITGIICPTKYLGDQPKGLASLHSYVGHISNDRDGQVVDRVRVHSDNVCSMSLLQQPIGIPMD